MKKSLLVVGLMMLLCLLGGKILFAEDDANLCKYHKNLYQAFRAEINNPNASQDILSEKEVYDRLIFLIKTSKCDSFRKQHADELPALLQKQKELATPIAKPVLPNS